ncbi:hypothetical protein [Tunturiibacter lichenicola]|uniref:hypothetical protein n=1 Tax=Tunturiibacter lichenicola TaxID=2051959 RepID=UPI003D9ADAFE
MKTSYPFFVLDSRTKNGLIPAPAGSGYPGWEFLFDPSLATSGTVAQYRVVRVAV